jgi:hypothetical protein
MDNRPAALAWDEIHIKPAASTAAITRLFMEGSSKAENGGTETETTDTVSPEPPAPH